MEWFAFALGLLVGVCAGCGLMAVIAAGASQERAEAYYEKGHATGYRKGMTDWSELDGPGSSSAARRTH